MLRSVIFTLMVLVSANTYSEPGHLIVVVGATGQQGGAVARELLSRGYQVRGLTRNPDSDRAKAVSALGVEMVKGDLGDPDSLKIVVNGAYGVFAMTSFWEHGYDGEVQHGKNIADAANAAGVKHFVYSSVANSDKKTGIPHFDSKWDVEEYLATLDMNISVIRPASFMQNFRSWRKWTIGGVVADPRRPESNDQYIALEDIGRFAAEAFDHPDEWIGKTLDIAGDSMSMRQLTGLMSSVLGKTLRYKQIGWDEYETESGEEMTIMMQWFDTVGYSIDVDALRGEHPWMRRLEDYLKE